MDCKHERFERELVLHDEDKCPLCLQSELTRLKAELKNVGLQKDANASLALEHKEEIDNLRKALDHHSPANCVRHDICKLLNEGA